MNLAPSVFYDNQQSHLNLWWQGTFFISVFFAITALLYGFDQRVLGDEVLWIKPLKFEISVIVHFITLAVLASLLSPTRRIGAVWKAMTYGVVAAGVIEVMYIFLQAARGRESHFNRSTGLEEIMYGLMGLGALMLVLGSFYLGCLLFREYQSNRNQPVLLASASGLIVGSVLTLVVAGYLSSGEAGVLSANAYDGLRLPLFGWYLNGQDLRIPHFFATHLMQLLPLYGFWLSRKNWAASGAYEKRILLATGISGILIMCLFALAIVLE